MSIEREDRPVIGITLALLAFFCFAVTDTSAKILATAGFPVLMIAFARYAVNLVLVLAWFVPREGRAVFKTNAPRIQLIRGMALLSSTVLNFWALKYLPLTTTIPIFFAMPLVVCLLSVPILGERVGFRRYVAVIVGFIGVLIIIRPGGVVFHWAMLISMAATITASLYFVFTRMIAGRDPMPVSQIYASGIATMALLPFVLGNWTTPTETIHWILLIAAGAAAGFGHSVLTIAYRFQEAAKLAPMIYSEMIYITIFSWILYSQLPDRWTVLGTLVIVGSGLYVWVRERQVAERTVHNLAPRT